MSMLALGLLCAAPALAAGSGNDFGAGTKLHLNSGTPSSGGSASFSGAVVRTIIGLLIVIVVIYGIRWLLKQAHAAKSPTVGDGLAQVASLPLGAGRSVVLVRVGEELHLLGVADHGITGIRVFTEEEAYELGLPFEPEDGYTSGAAGGLTPIQRVIESLRRFTVR